MTLRIEDYALIGDGESAALVGIDGSVDWLCWPRFDSAACFAALLGGPEHGRWALHPAGNITATKRRYLPDSLILETEFTTAQGVVTILDFMPPKGSASDLVRVVHGVDGCVSLCTELVIRFDYGSIVPWVTQSRGAETELHAVAGPDMLTLRTSIVLRGMDQRTVGEFEVARGQTVSFALTHSPSHLPAPQRIDADTALEQTQHYWRNWTGQCTYDGRWREAVLRSLITLKSLTYAPTGGIVAAPTTSLPEHIGGVRNWDYRYCWLRDATFTLFAHGRTVTSRG